MLTPEQIQNLKPGDPLIINGTFVDLDDEGDIEIKISYRLNSREIKDSVYGSPSCVSLPSEHGTSVPTTKYAPTRLFKKGDRIRFKTWHGFQPSDWENEAELLGKEATVYEDQEPDDFSVHFLFDGEDPDEEWHATYLPFIELVTPVEEIEPYKLIDSPNTYNIVRDSAMVMTIHKKSHPNAKAAAEAERDRLNEEWRKKQK